MGEDKAELNIEGKTFLERVLAELSSFEKVMISVNHSEGYEKYKYPLIVDEQKDCGPIGGITAALSVCCKDALMVVSCDLPLYRAALGEQLIQLLQEPWDAVVPCAEGKRIHPTCALYRTRCLPVFAERLRRGDYRLRAALTELNVRYAPMDHYSDMLRNVNTPDDYRAILQLVQNKQLF